MSLEPRLTGLLSPDAYPHPCRHIELIETHISWVLLTGDWAYKVKKPVDLGFVDFSTPERRRYFCEEELRCNRRFAPSLYVGVVQIVVMATGALRIVDASGGDGATVIEHAVRMRQFPAEMQADRLLASGSLVSDDLVRFADDLARVHGELPRAAPDSSYGDRAHVVAPMRENFAQIRGTSFASRGDDELERLARWTEREVAELATRIEARRTGGFVRECHGDLHLSNLAKLEGRLKGFDCLEFNPELRWIDVVNDVAFLHMDCLVRKRADLAYAFLDAYLERTGDYEGGRLLGLYLVYRSMVRAKVAALGAGTTPNEAAEARFDAHVTFALERALAPGPALILMCGLSGSGKSWLAERLVPRLGAIRLRSDVERKRLSGLAADARSGSEVDAGLYTADHNAAVYQRLTTCATALLEAGERVIVDAAFLTRARRAGVSAVAQRLGVPRVVAWCRADQVVIERRILDRERAGRDPSEAGLEVLARQHARFEIPDEEPVLAIDTGAPLDLDALTSEVRRTLKLEGDKPGT